MSLDDQLFWFIYFLGISTGMLFAMAIQAFIDSFFRRAKE